MLTLYFHLYSPKALILQLKRFVVKEKTRIQRSTVRKNPTEDDESGNKEKEEEESTPPPVEMVMLKNKDPVVVDKTFDLDQYLPKELKGSSKYKLSGIVHHHGGSASSGHYTSDAIRFDKDAKADEWVTFDDGSAHEANITKILKSPHSQRTAYLLLYTLEN
jgi:ubiquitin C-terminal hydrolase